MSLDEVAPFGGAYSDLVAEAEATAVAAGAPGAARRSVALGLVCDLARIGALAANELWQSRPAHITYGRFVDDLRHGLLAREFPVLARLQREYTTTRSDAVSELLTRARSVGDVADLTVGLGDPHRHGRSVAVVEFADGRRLVYKPRSLAPEALFYAAMADAGVAAEPMPEVIDCGDHGWVEIVRPGDRPDPEDYWRATGRLLRLVQVLGVGDLHHGNVIGRTDVAIPIDLECIAQPDVWPDDGDPGECFVRDSCKATGLLPSTFRGHGRIAVDMTGLVGAPGVTDGTTGVEWEGLGTDAIRPVPTLRATTASSNRPSDDRGAPVAVDLEALLCGYDEQVRAGIPEWVIERTATLRSRFLFRPTAAYVARLEAVRQPDRLRDEESFLSTLAELAELPDPFASAVGEDGLARVYDQEQAALRRLDVPIFEFDGSDLVLEDGSRLAGVAAISGVDRVRRRIARDSAGHRHADREIIRLSFEQTRHSRAVAPEPRAADEIHRELDLTVACAVDLGEQLLQEAIPLDGTDRLGWFEPVAAGPSGFLAGTVGRSDLYYGSAGIGLFFAALAEATGEARWGDAAVRCFGHDARDVDDGCAWLDAGWAGELWAAITVAHHLGDDDAASSRAGRLAHLLAGREPTDPEHLDLVGGWSGTLLAAAAVADLRDHDQVRAQVARLGGDIVEAVDGLTHDMELERKLRRLSVAHGSLGVSSAIRAAAAVTSDRSLLDWAARRRASEEQRVAARGGIGATMDHTREGRVPRSNWCWGAAGFLLSRDPAEIPPLHLEATVATLGPASTDRAHLCCGLAGQLEALLHVRHACSGAEERIDVIADALCDGEQHTFWSGVSAPASSLFRGRAGVGLALLHRAEATTIPSAVTLPIRLAVPTPI